MKITMNKLRRTIRRVIKEQVNGPLRISGYGTESYSFVLGQDDFFQVSLYDDDFEKLFVDKLMQAKEQGYENVQLAGDYLTVDEMIQKVREIEASMY